MALPSLGLFVASRDTAARQWKRNGDDILGYVGASRKENRKIAQGLSGLTFPAWRTNLYLGSSDDGSSTRRFPWRAWGVLACSAGVVPRRHVPMRRDCFF
jgi:hypothetical protein